ncbi:uncharacterized protein [Montipora capricornis]|uniref:uncharacterized protein n=1 Tax=Montipora capricornis TaxID=246305 RepID=UPI0035F19BEC
MTKDGAEDLEHEAKKPKYHPDHEPCEDMWSSDSSGDEDLEAAMSNHGFTRVNDCEDILGNDTGCFNGVSSHMEGNDEVVSSDTDRSESKSESDWSESCCSDDEDPEDWHEEADDLLEDMANDEPLPEPIRHRSSTQTLTILLQWFVYFLLFWQATCKISDNGLEWLLRFMFQFMHVMGITFHSEYLCQMSLMLPSSLYLLREFVNLKRDNFVKFAVCPKCASLYNLESCTRLVGGQIVSNVCSHRPFSKGRSSECGTALARRVILASGKVCFYPHRIYCFNSVIDQVEGLLKRPGVPEMCEQWRERQVDDNIVADVYDETK